MAVDWHHHKDFQKGGFLNTDPFVLDEKYPPHKKEQFFNYMLLIHPEISGVWLAYYSISILNERWESAEHIIFKECASSHDMFSFIENYVIRFNVPHKDIPEWAFKKMEKDSPRF